LETAYGERGLLLAHVAVDRARGGQDDAFDAHVADGFHQRHRPADVDRVIVARVQDGFLYRDACREMVDHVHVLEERPQLGTVVHVSAREVDVGRQRLRVARGKVVQSAHLIR